MRDAVICEPVRTPVGAFGGALRDVPVQDLGAVVVRELMRRTELPPDAVDELVLGHGYPSMDAPALGRVVALDAGLPTSVGGFQLDRRCGSGLQAILLAAMQIQTGVSDVVIAGGAESMSRAPFFSAEVRAGIRNGPGLMLHDSLTRGRLTAGGQNFPLPGGMIETAEAMREKYSISRREQDEYAVRSHERAAAAWSAGTFDDEVVPVSARDRTGEFVVDRDEHVRRDTSVEKLGRLRPIMSDPDSTVTAGNASGQNDGAAVCVVTFPERAAELGLTPLARLVSWGHSGTEPRMLGTAPVPATAKVLNNAGVTLDEVGLIELNEAFAAQVLACTREWGFGDADFDRLNVHGSGISLGHPIGATGARILTTLTREMQRREARYGLETMCIAGGQGLAALFERVA
ncbi:acetyl-CoA C-acetyltransferase [Prauserella cavernicola]|uniref:Probable acetyl-CoA acetyltransferase n=1 Tax=Prauserella cavernicola TaxID=2800127 RepID=A0A934QXM5_9PSEU|nr:acetyl-CoA C-acetyltransferase [Prauserella cavernicola]MBK1787169.1 acetyl-CoA C-acetyltransferase [Prauserella cavernicola]